MLILILILQNSELRHPAENSGSGIAELRTIVAVHYGKISGSEIAD
jgi:hypothetical protein